MGAAPIKNETHAFYLRLMVRQSERGFREKAAKEYEVWLFLQDRGQFGPPPTHGLATVLPNMVKS